MSDPQQERLDDLEQSIEDTRRTAQEHGTLPEDPDDPEKPTFIDPDADGDKEGTRAQPPG
jgi:hypothetical protein